MQGEIHSINISGSGGVPKLPIKEVFVRFEGVEGDFNRFRMEKKGGDIRRAISIFSLERIVQLQEEGHPIDIGTAGENFTIEGIDWTRLGVGMTIKLGSAIIRLSEPCAPCSKIGRSFIENKFSRIDQNKREGWSRWSASVIEEGSVSVGDAVYFEET
ncbi:MAG: sulfurase [Rhodobacteraceae bacterium]|nr:sulfurase [Paracoccaceae bacterium]|tara:strand:+ start:326 stop:799 length:474 start_codon:yes stop_codon:yes gene_type:complete